MQARDVANQGTLEVTVNPPLENIEGPVEKNADTRVAQVGKLERIDKGATPERDHGRGNDFAYMDRFQTAEGGLTILAKDTSGLPSLGLFDAAVEILEGQPQRPGQAASDGGFPGSHESG